MDLDVHQRESALWRDDDMKSHELYLTTSSNNELAGNTFLQWELIPDGNTYKIKSVSSRNYLDGRNSSNTGIEVYLTNSSNRTLPKYLQWIITKAR